MNNVVFSDPKVYNADVLFIWYKINLQMKKADNIKEIQDFLGKYGRGKYVEPLFHYYALMNYNEALGVYNSLK